MPGATTAVDTAMADMVLDTAVDTTGTARGLLMPMPGVTDTAVPTDTMAVMADTATGTARGPLMSRSSPRSPPDPTLTLTSMVPTPTPDTDTPAPTPHTPMAPTLMELTPMEPTTTARGPLTPTPGATDTAADTAMAVTVTAASDTTDKRSAVLMALSAVILMSSNHPHHTKYLSHSC